MAIPLRLETTLKLSDAIALGSADSKPNPGTLTNLNGGRCAMGMAFHAAGIEDGYMHLITLERTRWSYITHYPCKCYYHMYGPLAHTTLNNAVVHLFDTHVCAKQDWTLDRLIEWVHSVEVAHETPQPTPSPAPDLDPFRPDDNPDPIADPDIDPDDPDQDPTLGLTILTLK